MIKLLVCIIIMIIFLFVYFNIPFSPIRKQFNNDVAKEIKSSLSSNSILTKEDIAHLPLSIRNYLEHCGYLDRPKMSYLNMEYQDVTFKQGRNGLNLIIDYSQYNFPAEPCRLAFINSKLFGIPFEGYDYYQKGKGGMKGVIGKAITLFDSTGPEMDKACLVTYLAESLFCPDIILNGFISFEEINDYKVKATISYDGVSASGIFEFNDQYEMVSFSTDDRAQSSTDGKIEFLLWSAICSDYHLSNDGIRIPGKFQAIWHYPDEDFIYFDGTISSISYGN